MYTKTKMFLKKMNIASVFPWAEASDNTGYVKMPKKTKQKSAAVMRQPIN